MIELEPTSMQWRKSDRSTGQGGNCVEIARLTAVIAVRDSKNPTGPTLAFDTAAFTAFAVSIRSGDHDR